MTDWSIRQIRTQEDAEAYYKQIGCSSFHMDTEYPKRSEEYKRLGIPRETEQRWAIEELDRMLEEIAKPVPNEDLWWLHSQIADFATGNCAPGGIKKFYQATLLIIDRLEDMDKILVAENIIGRAQLWFMGGTVYFARIRCKRKIAKHLAKIALDLAKQAHASGIDQERTAFLLKECKRIRMVSRFF